MYLTDRVSERGSRDGQQEHSHLLQWRLTHGSCPPRKAALYVRCGSAPEAPCISRSDFNTLICWQVRRRLTRMDGRDVLMRDCLADAPPRLRPRGQTKTAPHHLPPDATRLKRAAETPSYEKCKRWRRGHSVAGRRRPPWTREQTEAEAPASAELCNSSHKAYTAPENARVEDCLPEQPANNSE